MRFFFFFIFVFHFSQSVNSQEEIITITSNTEILQSFNVVDSKTGNFAIFLEESDLVKGFLYDKNYRLISKIHSEDLASKYKEFIGFKIQEKTITLFMNTKNDRSYGVLIFDFEKETSVIKEIDFKLKGEDYIESVSYNNNYYLISRPRNSNQFNIYTFNDNFSVNQHEIIFKKDEFLDMRDRPIHLYDLIRKTVKINNKSPNAIEATSQFVKLYQKDNNVLITSDIYNEYTYLINLNLDTFGNTTDRFLQPEYERSITTVKSNSYVYEDKLYQIISSTKDLDIQIIDLSTKEIIKKHRANKEQPIDFKNTKIILEGGDFKKHRELNKTSQFLRKMSQSHIGISVYNHYGINQVTIGGISDGSGGFGFYIFAGAMVGGVVGGVIVASFNSMTYSYYGYANSKSVQITGLFDQNFEHLEGNVIDNPFEEMKSFLKGNKHFKAKTVFNYDDDYLFGFYNEKINLYEVFKIGEDH